MPQPDSPALNAPISPVFLGKETTLTLPSGRVVRIRESNGDDDDILSRLGDTSDGSNINNFLANIITEDFEHPGQKLRASDLLKWKVNDKYYLLFKQRLINHGNVLKFTHTCQNERCKKETMYEDKIDYIDGDLSREDFTPSHKYQVKRYPHNGHGQVELVLASDKKLRFKILTGELEKRQLDIPNDDSSKNKKVAIRELQQFKNGAWELVTYFGEFSSREMSKIREAITINDSTFEPIIEVVCSHCNTPYVYSLMTLPAFYYPEETT